MSDKPVSAHLTSSLYTGQGTLLDPHLTRASLVIAGAISALG